MNPEEFLVPIAAFTMSFGIVYVIVTARHRQRMAMIEKGMAPMPEGPRGSGTLKFGLLSMGIGLGLLLGFFLDWVMFPDPSNDNPVAYFIMVLTCGGSALIAHHFITVRKQQG